VVRELRVAAKPEDPNMPAGCYGALLCRSLPSGNISYFK
jgi:hypothetical protein